MEAKVISKLDVDGGFIFPGSDDPSIWYAVIEEYVI